MRYHNLLCLGLGTLLVEEFFHGYFSRLFANNSDFPMATQIACNIQVLCAFLLMLIYAGNLRYSELKISFLLLLKYVPTFFLPYLLILCAVFDGINTRQGEWNLLGENGYFGEYTTYGKDYHMLNTLIINHLQNLFAKIMMPGFIQNL